LYFSWQHIKIN